MIPEQVIGRRTNGDILLQSDSIIQKKRLNREFSRGKLSFFKHFVQNQLCAQYRELAVENSKFQGTLSSTGTLFDNALRRASPHRLRLRVLNLHSYAEEGANYSV